jgi:hypothetical protein
MSHSAVGPISPNFPTHPAHPSGSGVNAVPHPPTQSQEDLIRVFNTVLLSTQSQPDRDYSREIFELMETPAFRAILSSVRQLARLNGMTERQAAEQIITTFRKVDQVWRDYVFHEGVERIKGG